MRVSALFQYVTNITPLMSHQHNPINMELFLHSHEASICRHRQLTTPLILLLPTHMKSAYSDSQNFLMIAFLTLSFKSLLWSFSSFKSSVVWPMINYLTRLSYLWIYFRTAKQVLYKCVLTDCIWHPRRSTYSHT